MGKHKKEKPYDAPVVKRSAQVAVKPATSSLLAPTSSKAFPLSTPPGELPITLSLVETVSAPVLKLDLGCGQNPKEGFEGVDLYGEKCKHRVNLFTFPWPFADNSVDEIHSSHFLEHIPAREVEEQDLAPNHTRREFLGQDMLFAFMDECWRILKPDGWMQIIVPSARSNRAFQDPTHRRFFVQETFFYFWADWRKANGLDHYRVKCNFGAESVVGTMPGEEALRSVAAQQERHQHFWNTTYDWHARMKKLPRPV